MLNKLANNTRQQQHYYFPLNLKTDLFFFCAAECRYRWAGVKILRLFAVIIYSFKIIIRQHQRNVRSSAPLLPSHQWVIITILLLLSSSLTGWPALKYTLNRLQACTKWPIGSLLSVIEPRNSQQGGQWLLQTQSCLSSQTCCIYEGNQLLLLHWNLPFVPFLTSCTKYHHHHHCQLSSHPVLQAASTTLFLF